MRIGFFQFAPRRLEIEANVARIARTLEGLRDAVVVLPELCLSGYLFRNRRELEEAALEPDDGRLGPLFGVLASNGLVAAVGLAERAREGIYNSLLLAGPAGPVAIYRKIHLFDRETRFFLPGDAPPPVVEAAGARLGLMVCWDWYFPETARTLARAGAQVILHAANLVLPWCLDAMRTRSLENRVFTVTANRVGVEEVSGVRQEFRGGSQVLGTRGETLLAAGGASVEGVFTVEIVPAEADDKRMTARNPGPWEVRADLLRYAEGLPETDR